MDIVFDKIIRFMKENVIAISQKVSNSEKVVHSSYDLKVAKEWNISLDFP